MNNNRSLVQTLMPHGSSSRDRSSTGTTAEFPGSDSSSAFPQPRFSDLLPTTESSATTGFPAQKSSHFDGPANSTADAAVEGWMETSMSHDCPCPLKSTADAGAGDGAGGGRMPCPLSRGLFARSCMLCHATLLSPVFPVSRDDNGLSHTREISPSCRSSSTLIA